jgi:hypothetical protein
MIDKAQLEYELFGFDAEADSKNVGPPPDPNEFASGSFKPGVSESLRSQEDNKNAKMYRNEMAIELLAAKIKGLEDSVNGIWNAVQPLVNTNGINIGRVKI